MENSYLLIEEFCISVSILHLAVRCLSYHQIWRINRQKRRFQPIAVAHEKSLKIQPVRAMSYPKGVKNRSVMLFTNNSQLPLITGVYCFPANVAFSFHQVSFNKAEVVHCI
jgi:hypothetical protein